jgi:hypothetical protein
MLIQQALVALFLSSSYTISQSACTRIAPAVRLKRELRESTKVERQ